MARRSLPSARRCSGGGVIKGSFWACHTSQAALTCPRRQSSFTRAFQLLRVPGFRSAGPTQIKGFSNTKAIHGAPSVVARREGGDQPAPGAFRLCCIAEPLVAEPEPEEPARLQGWGQRPILASTVQQVAGTIPSPSEKCLAGEVPLELPDVGIVGPLVQGDVRTITSCQSHAGRGDGS